MRRPDPELLPSLGTVLRSHRRAAGLTQNELAEKAGLSLAAVRDLEQGRRSRPRTGSMMALSGALGLDDAQTRELERAAKRDRSRSGQSRAETIRHPAIPDHGLWISVLGPLSVWQDGKPVPIGSPARQAVLGRLAVDPGMPVQRETLLDLLWGERPPRTAANLVQAHVSRLRYVLRPSGHGRGGPTIASASGSYRLRVLEDELDLTVFAKLARGASAARESGALMTACAIYEQAFALHQGDPCGNISLLWQHPAVADVRRELAETLLGYAQVAADLGRHDLVLRRLQGLAAAEPLNERVLARLMVALAGSGQQAEALWLYEDLRARLDRELGLYPGEELAETHLRLLRGDFNTVGGRRARSPGTTEHVTNLVPRQLPASARYFTGRDHELRELTALASSLNGPAATLPIVALTGMAGIGKSALAVHWAHAVADRFPDGQLFTDLRGFSPAGIAVSPAKVIRGFLGALGVPDWQVPADLDSQRTLYRSLLANKQVLIVLDNAQDAEQIRPLLPGAPGCLVLITSRNRLTGLAASHGTHLLALDCLTTAESRRLLALGLGEERVRAESHAASELIALCAQLPLALCNTIARAIAQPGLPLAELAAGMRDDQGRLDTLETGERVTSARMVFSWSHAKLSRRAERVFRLISVHPGPDVTVPSAASLAGLSRREASLALAELSDGCLVTEHVPGRYTCHELLKAYAAEIARTRETDDERHVAARRLLDHYLHTVDNASQHLMPNRIAVIPRRPPLHGVVPEVFSSAAEASEWLRDERFVLLSAIGQAAYEGISPYAWELPWAAGPFLRGVACWEMTARALEYALVVACRTGNTTGQAIAHQHLGWLRLRQGAFAAAYGHLDMVLHLAGQLKNRYLAALAYLLRARALRSQGRINEGMTEAEKSLSLFRAVGDRHGEFRALVEAVWHLRRLGDREVAAVLHSRVRELQRSLRDGEPEMLSISCRHRTSKNFAMNVG